MSRLLFILSVLFLSGHVRAQDDLGYPLSKFLEACIMERESMASGDLDGIASSIAQFRKLLIEDFKSHSFVTKEPMDTSALEGHLLFSADYLDQYILDEMEKETVSVATDSHIIRNATKGAIIVLVTHCLIPAQQTCVYEFDGTMDMQLLVVCERAQLLGVTIDVPSEEFHYECPNDEPNGIRYHSWSLNDEGKVQLSISNPCEEAVSVVVASYRQ
ncbi:MAG: hypothetical protein IKT00_04355 [Prevotella sp.]|nr:hypothetical protein [Prevotella sp.]